MRINNPSKVFDYTLLADRESQSPTVFVLRRLTWEEIGEYQIASPLSLSDAMRAARIVAAAEEENRKLTDEEAAQIDAAFPDTPEHIVRITAAYAKILPYGILEIRNLQDESGAPITLEPKVFVKAAPGAVIRELGQELMRISRLPEAERKNSSAPRAPGRAAGTAASARARRRSPKIAL